MHEFMINTNSEAHLDTQVLTFNGIPEGADPNMTFVEKYRVFNENYSSLTPTGPQNILQFDGNDTYQVLEDSKEDNLSK